MRAHSCRRFAIVIGVAAAGAIALGAQTTAASAGVHKYDTKQYLTHEGGGECQHSAELWGQSPTKPWAGHHCVLWEGGVTSKVRKCMEGRRVVLFRKLPGTDRKLGFTRTVWAYKRGDWKLVAPKRGRVYAKVRRKVGDGYVCRADRSPIDQVRY